MRTLCANWAQFGRMLGATQAEIGSKLSLAGVRTRAFGNQTQTKGRLNRQPTTLLRGGPPWSSRHPHLPIHPSPTLPSSHPPRELNGARPPTREIATTCIQAFSVKAPGIPGIGGPEIKVQAYWDRRKRPRASGTLGPRHSSWQPTVLHRNVGAGPEITGKVPRLESSSKCE